jgi:hypothetical protein
MKFFIPGVKSAEGAEKNIARIRKFAEKTTGAAVTGKRIFRICYQCEGEGVSAEVGKPEQSCGEPVIAILESDSFLICTPSNGVLSGTPVSVEKAEAGTVEEFVQ